MTQTQTATKPIDRFLPLLKGIKSQRYNGRGNPGFTACCPAHNDSEASLLVWEDTSDNHVGIKCFAGCTRKAIVEAVGLTESDLYIDGKTHTESKDTISVFELAADKLIHPSFLALLDITDGYTPRAVHIPYHLLDGKPYEKKRIRTALEAKRGSYWSKSDVPLIPYGLDRLEQARKAKYLVIVEGESDCWTLWFHGFPALGVPGAENFACIALDHLKGIEQVYIMQESDAAGRKFAGEVCKHLLNISYTGGISILDLKSSHQAKDPNELHKRDIKAFKGAFEQAIQKAIPWRKPRQKPTLQRLRDLQQEILPETKWAIEPILPEGVTILGGKPKLGKSWLALAILSAIASGSVALNEYPVERGEVLYIDLEDGKKRLKNRANTFLKQALASEDFYYITDCPRIDEGGLDFLSETINERPSLRLICIDTWARFKPKPRGRIQMQYDEDYDALQPLQKLASDKGISILVVDHMRKMESEDPIDQISGSVGKTGAVDGFLLLYRKRQETDAHLFVIGRDIEEEQDLLLSFSRECASWIVKGEADKDAVAGTPERQVILDLLQRYPEGLTCKEIAAKLDNKNVNTTRNLLIKLRDVDNKIVYENNKYLLTKSSNHSKHSKDSKRSNHSNLEDSSPGVTTEDHEVTTPYYGSIVTPNPLADMPVEPIHSNGNGHLTTVTTLTIDEMKKSIFAYGQAHNFPRLRLSDETIIPTSKDAWAGFLKYQMHKHQRAYEDILAGKVVEVQA